MHYYFLIFYLMTHHFGLLPVMFTFADSQIDTDTLSQIDTVNS